MPSDMAKAVRLYHTPDQMKQALKNSWARSQSAANARTAADHTFQISEEPDIISDSSLARRRSAAARAILDEATNGICKFQTIQLSAYFSCSLLGFYL